jgi:hypothetical protein
MNQRVLLLLLNLYSKGQALYHKTTSKKLSSQLSWYKPNQSVGQQFDIIPAYRNSTGRSVSSSDPIYNIERIMMVVLYTLAESISLITTRRYQNSKKSLNLILFKSICQTMPKTACFDEELKMIG